MQIVRGGRIVDVFTRTWGDPGELGMLNDGDEDGPWPEDDLPDDVPNPATPAEAVAAVERFLAHAERLGFTS